MVKGAQVDCIEFFPAKIIELSREKKRDSHQDATNHSVKVWNFNHMTILTLVPCLASEVSRTLTR